MTWRTRGLWWLHQYCRNVLYGFDMFVNTVFLAGDPKETLSSRMAKRAADGRFFSRLGCRFLDVLDRGHCVRALRSELGGRQIWAAPWKSVAFGLAVVGAGVALYVVL